MFKIEKGLYDLFIWNDIQHKYQMKYLNRYKEIEIDFINDLLKHKIITVKYDENSYYTFSDILQEKRILSKQINQLRKLCKRIYKYDITDYSEFGRVSEKVIWE